MKNKKRKITRTTRHPESRSVVQPFIAHVRELRQRLMYVVASIIAFGVLGYLLQDRIIAILLHPARDQQFIYTTPGGGFNFLVSISIYFGLAGSVPLMVYHIFRFFEPLLRRHSRRFMIYCGVFSAVLAVLGALFGYYIGLPAALMFLLNQFQTTQIQPLLTIQDYISFVMVYIIGFALLFQIPLILLFINKITRLRPRKLFGFQRFVITGAFIAAAIITPSGDAINQLIMAGPIIAMYQFGIVGVWLYNHRNKYERLVALHARDAEVQAARQSRQVTIQIPEPIPSRPVAQQTTRPAARRSQPYTTATRWADNRPAVRAPIVYFEDIRRVPADM